MLHVTKLHETRGQTVRAIDDVTFDIEAGTFVSIMGPSGSGKSTLMSLIGLLDTPSSGQYRLAGRDVAALGPDQRAYLRSRAIGFVFQSFNLLARNTALENVELALRYAGVVGKDRNRRSMAALEEVGLGHRFDHWPHQLSGGEQQRVAIARALVNNPDIILADEPTGALDRRNGDDILAKLKELHVRGRTIVMVTHDPELAAHAERTIELSDGRIARDQVAASPVAAVAKPALLDNVALVGPGPS